MKRKRDDLTIDRRRIGFDECGNFSKLGKPFIQAVTPTG
jgi:hypothetical protein